MRKRRAAAQKVSYVRKVADYGFDHRGRALIARARSLWLLGYPDRAVAAGHLAIEAAEELDHPVSLCIALLYSATVFIWAGDWDAADQALDKLVAQSQSHMLMYRSVGGVLRDVVKCSRGTSTIDVGALRQSLDALLRDRHLILMPMYRTMIADVLLSEGRPKDAEPIVDAALEDLGPGLESVDGPEVLRMKGVVEAALGRADQAEHFLLRAIDLAREQAALSWELRATMSLAAIRTDKGGSQAASILRPALNRFTEGFGTGDLSAARLMIERLTGQSQ